MFEPLPELGEFRYGELRAVNGQAEGVRNRRPFKQHGSGRGAGVTSKRERLIQAAPAQAEGLW
jgi:hypothetical protein